MSLEMRGTNRVVKQEKHLTQTYHMKGVGRISQTRLFWGICIPGEEIKRATLAFAMRKAASRGGRGPRGEFTAVIRNMLAEVSILIGEEHREIRPTLSSIS